MKINVHTINKAALQVSMSIKILEKKRIFLLIAYKLNPTLKKKLARLN